ncbi:MAG TPA: lipoyl(octanoyl) transferase LipB [Paludibacteraceae bacterium]|nr:lipoyl(octanoyl) transferase LipB [Paludibacteraceae bacterium]HQB69430.1 lipoyl(octanoyl) transferase LipB [Paludibacteraceae bacterium]HRS67889.1 lipoyl(octanoyl) transferase LipB [Paludibacteraceae bacterium]
MSFVVEYWGVVDYQTAWERQTVLFDGTILQKINNQTTTNYLVFCEHPHVYTLGKSGHTENMLYNPHAVPFVRTNRGGDITYHGPGQIVGYPIFDLDTFHLGLKEYIYKVEEAIILTLSYFGITSMRLEHATGVWLDVEKPTCRKICAIGVKSSRFVTMHGFALNVNTDLSFFQNINPCGFVDKGVTSMEQELGRKLDLLEVERRLTQFFSQLF